MNRRLASVQTQCLPPLFGNVADIASMAVFKKAVGRALFFQILFLPDKQHKMFKKPAVGFAILLALTLTAFQSAQAAMVNGGFELPSFAPAPLFHQIPQGTVPGWRTYAGGH